MARVASTNSLLGLCIVCIGDAVNAGVRTLCTDFLGDLHREQNSLIGLSIGVAVSAGVINITLFRDLFRDFTENNSL